MKRRTAICIGILAALVLLGSLVQIFRICRTESSRRQAGALMEAGDYEQARLIYNGIGDMDGAARCAALQLEKYYQDGKTSLESGDYETAHELLLSAGDYQDAAALLAQCDWLHASVLTAEGRLTEARSLYLGLGDYPGCQAALEAVNTRLYEQAEMLAGGFRLEEAAGIWQELGSFSNSERMLWRCRRALAWASAPETERLLRPEKRYLSDSFENVYACEQGFVVVPEECGSDTRFFIYYPGGRNEELSVDYLLYYLMNPSPNTMAVFMRRNGLEEMRAKTGEAMDLLEQAAAECGLFVHDVVTAGSSLGAYTAMHSAVYTYKDYGIKTDCVLSLDAGSDWLETELLLDEQECRETEALGTEFYLFESPWVGMNRDGICLMVNTGNKVTMVGCYFDDHVRISLDAMGMGVVDWAVGDRSKPCNPEIYEFTRLRPDSGAEDLAQ